ncbi:hypothetical protein [Snodgrassella alvi]|nr:hypothetical protein [Snodgrassella alvi]
MIMQFFNQGKGGGAGSVNYLQGRNHCREGTQLLRGNADDK